MQGVGMDDIIKYRLNTLSDKRQSDLAGNSFLPQLFFNVFSLFFGN